MEGRVKTPLGTIPTISSRLTAHDHLGAVKVRLGIGRMHYTVYPGIYALGRPGDQSPILVTANYKLSFDALRRELAGRSVWILVLDTNGINVWCAAGKGSFGTGNLAQTVKDLRLVRLVKDRRLILPQLGAPGVAAHLVKKSCGFKVAYGPIKAADLPAYLDAGQKATPAMRSKDFPLGERLALAPMELVPGLGLIAPIGLALMLLGGLLGQGPFWDEAFGPGLVAGLGLIWAMATASLLGPALLPWLPGKAFSLKGLWLGILGGAFWLWAWGALDRALPAAGLMLIFCALASFTLMNFTGSSTYTSRSGVLKEMRRYIPLQAGGFLAGLILWGLGLAL